MTKNELEEEIKTLKDRIAELEKKLENTNEFEVGDNYYFITAQGEVLSAEWDNDELDLTAQQIGNCFKTKEEAEFMVERLKVIKELEYYAKEHNNEIDWSDTKKCKYAIGYECDYNYCTSCTASIYKTNNIYFSSREIAKNAIKEIGEERIRKYYLRME